MTAESEAEFTALVRRQSRFVYRVAYSVLLNASDAEDVVQETFLKLYRNDGWRRADNECAFLARVAWRTAIDRRRAAPPVASSDDELLGTVKAIAPTPEAALVAADEHAALHALINALSEELRIPLVLGIADELNSREIASILNIPEGTVRTRQQRARQVLRQKLESLRVRNQEPRHA